MTIEKQIDIEFKKRLKSLSKFIFEIKNIEDKPTIWNFRNRTFLKKHSKRIKKRLKDLSVEFIPVNS